MNAAKQPEQQLQQPEQPEQQQPEQQQPEIDATCQDFLTVSPPGTFDAVIMNPPFKDGADIKHILHAREFLKPGGRLVAICAGGPRQVDKLKPLCESWEELPEGTFDGTGVRAVLLTMQGPS
jgi:16S rRNA G1207 methylase RsmC